jgi:hypothetical protein
MPTSSDPGRSSQPRIPRDLGEALDTATANQTELREALDTASGTLSETIDPLEYGPTMTTRWSELAARQRWWTARLWRALSRVDVWILIATIVGGGCNDRWGGYRVLDPRAEVASSA